MNAVTSTAPEPALLSHWAERRLAFLDNAMECATRLIHAEMRCGLAAEPAEPTPDGRARHAPFISLVRCLRQTAALQARLEAGKFPPLRDDPPPDYAAAVAAERAQAGNRKQRIRRALEDSIENTASGERAEDLTRDLRERLDDPDFDSEFADQPIGQVVAAICEELGLPFEERRWTEAEMGEEAPPEEARQGDPPGAVGIEPQTPQRQADRQDRFNETRTPNTDPAPD